MGFVSRDAVVYVSEPVSGGFALYAVSIETGERKLVAQNDAVPFSSHVQDSATGRIVALEYEPDLPNYEFVDPRHPLQPRPAGPARGPAERERGAGELHRRRPQGAGPRLQRPQSGRLLLVDAATLAEESLGQVRP